MPGQNLSRDEAQARSALLAPARYDVTIDLSGRRPDGTPLAEPERTFVSTSRIRFTAKAAGTTHLDLIAQELVSATLDGHPLEEFSDSRLPLTVEAGDHDLTVTAVCRYSRTGEGLHRFVDPADGRVYTYTQFEVPDARRMFACFEQPDLKAVFAFTVLAPSHWTVISNAARVAPTPEDEEIGRWTFGDTLPISTYITAVVAGEYASVETTYEGKGGTVPMSIVCRQSLREHLDAEAIFATAQRGFAVFEEAFDHPYPFGSYDQAFVPEYNMGAMENAGCITYRDEYLFRSRATASQYFARDNTILHELAHMWFGDLVTMSWWDDLWLNESFAEWASHFAQSEIMHDNPEHAWADFCNNRKNWAYRQDQLPTTHPIAADMVDLEAVDQNFDGITYAKGASVLRQLVAFVGREAFLTGVRRYFARHAFGNTRLVDLLDALTEASGRDLSGWAGEWLEVAGVNTMSAEFEVDGEDRFSTFAIRQTADPAHPTLRHHRLAIGLYALVDNVLTRVHQVETDVAGEHTEVMDLIGLARPDLVLVNDGDLTYTKIRMDPRSLQTVVDHIDRLDSELARALCRSAAWDMCRDAEMRPGDYVRLALRSVPDETDLAGVAATLAQAELAACSYTAREHRDEVRAVLEQGLVQLLDGAEPGSDHQLAFTRALASAARSDEVGDRIASWLAGEQVPSGLTIDDDLRWRLVTALAGLGRLGEEDIDRELERDNTISGAEAAGAARAARPDGAAKAAAWHAAVEDPDVPNESQRKICHAFVQLDQDDLLRPYVDRYLQLCEDISAKRGPWADRGLSLQNNALLGLFPATLADHEFIEHLDVWRTSVELSEPVLRSVSERRDAAVRALRCQRADARAAASTGS